MAGITSVAVTSLALPFGCWRQGRRGAQCINAADKRASGGSGEQGTFTVPRHAKAQRAVQGFFGGLELALAHGANLWQGSAANAKERRLSKLRVDHVSAKAGSPSGPINVLVIGGGGREHALSWGIAKSPLASAVYCAPGNPGIAEDGIVCLPDLNPADHAAVLKFCKEKSIGMVVIGPEAPLVAGLGDDLRAAGFRVFGPSRAAAALEGSKKFMKSICDKYGVPTAEHRAFTDAAAAKAYIKQRGVPIVVKADGLAAGKGVVVATTVEQALAAIDSMLVSREFGDAGSQVVIEEFLRGEEASFFAITDGETALPLASAQDHKAVGDGDTGPNTGGMGAYSPAPVVTPAMVQEILCDIIRPTVAGMKAEGCPFQGVLYAGLMIDPATNKPKLLEYNVRFGDPECQALIMRTKSDLVQLLMAACDGTLSSVNLEYHDQPSLCVVLASQGYPGSYKKGSVIRGLANAGAVQGVKVFHAGTAADASGEVVAVGGRVLGVTAMGPSVKQAQARAYEAVGRIDWPEGFCRRDIGWRAVVREEGKK
eukprot:jgi/Mesvir1/4820/Mv11109-RA.1